MKQKVTCVDWKQIWFQSKLLKRESETHFLSFFSLARNTSCMVLIWYWYKEKYIYVNFITNKMTHKKTFQKISMIFLIPVCVLDNYKIWQMSNFKRCMFRIKLSIFFSFLLNTLLLLDIITANYFFYKPKYALSNDPQCHDVWSEMFTYAYG